MLQPGSGRTERTSYLVEIEIDPARINPTQVGMKLADSVSWVEGCGKVKIVFIGSVKETDQIKLEGE